MRRVIAAINMTIDGFCDHTAIDPDEEIHYHYARLLDDAGIILYGRVTYQLMQFWQSLLIKPSGEKSMDDFAGSIDKVPKLVFSKTLKDTGWNSAELADTTPEEAVRLLKQHPGKNIFIGSRSLINQLMNAGLIDELQLCIHPVVAGSGQHLFNKTDRRLFRITGIKSFKSGAVIHFYEPVNS